MEVERSEEAEAVPAEEVDGNSVVTGDIPGECQQEQQNEDDIDPCRVQIKNLPKFLGHKAVRQLLDKTLGNDAVKKIRQMRDTAYVTLTSEEKAQDAIAKLDGMVLKKFKLQCILAASEPLKGRDLPQANSETTRIKTARESVTPLADMPYLEQLKKKTTECHKLARRFLNEFYSARVEGMKNVNSHQMLNPIVPFTSTHIYRNKCEFTVGKDLDGNVRVGFVGGRFSKNEHYVLPVDECPNLSPQTKAIVAEFASFVRESGLATFNEFTREGTWKMLTVRELSGDVMIIVTVFPFSDADLEEAMKKKLIKRHLSYLIPEEFHSTDTLSRGFRITSVYWQTQAHASDEPLRHLVSGSPYIYETVFGVRFRVSPDAFFQTNSTAAALLYSTIGQLCHLDTEEAKPSQAKEEARNDEDGVLEKKVKMEEDNRATGVKEEAGNGEDGVPEKKVKLEVNDGGAEVKAEPKGNGAPVNVEQKTILLDICCGTGTIGQCIMKNIGTQRAANMCCIGVELVESAVEDAKANARDNGISEKLCSYVAGKAEDTFRQLWRHVPEGFSLDSARVVGILDPPRRGIHPKVVVTCRELKSLRRLLYVSCDPAGAMKNITDLCRPTSNKFSGQPFRLEKITPVDMFPMTEHFEWIITLVR